VRLAGFGWKPYSSPGDIRNCMVALSSMKPGWGDCFPYRFQQAMAGWVTTLELGPRGSKTHVTGGFAESVQFK